MHDQPQATDSRMLSHQQVLLRQQIDPDRKGTDAERDDEQHRGRHGEARDRGDKDDRRGAHEERAADESPWVPLDPARPAIESAAGSRRDERALIGFRILPSPGQVLYRLSTSTSTSEGAWPVNRHRVRVALRVSRSRRYQPRRMNRRPLITRISTAIPIQTTPNMPSDGITKRTPATIITIAPCVPLVSRHERC